MQLFKISNRIENTGNLHKISYWEGGIVRIINLKILSNILNVNEQVIKTKIIEYKGILKNKKIIHNNNYVRVLPEQLYFYEKNILRTFYSGWKHVC